MGQAVQVWCVRLCENLLESIVWIRSPNYKHFTLRSLYDLPSMAAAGSSASAASSDHPINSAMHACPGQGEREEEAGHQQQLDHTLQTAPSLGTAVDALELSVAAGQEEVRAQQGPHNTTLSASEPPTALLSADHPSTAQRWQRPEADVALRQGTAQRLVELFHARRPSMEDAFKARLPRLVRKLEEGLYHSAASLEAYQV